MNNFCICYRVMQKVFFKRLGKEGYTKKDNFHIRNHTLNCLIFFIDKVSLCNTKEYHKPSNVSRLHGKVIDVSSMLKRRGKDQKGCTPPPHTHTRCELNRKITCNKYKNE